MTMPLVNGRAPEFQPSVLLLSVLLPSVLQPSERQPARSPPWLDRTT